MLFDSNFQYRIRKKAAWIRGKRNNQAAIPTDIAEIKDVIFVQGKLAYMVEYEDYRVGYIFFEELESCEIFQLETKVNKETIVSV
jgi:hypothetical protein